ncbi:MAG: DNA-directed RNA polymerase subunit A'' [Candidatus Aenigmatarchaeota archaeon]
MKVKSLKELPPKLREEAKEKMKAYRLTAAQKSKIEKKIIEMYNKSLFEAGEAFGMVAAQSISEPATQMCVDYDENVLTKDAGRIEIVKVGHFIDQNFERFGFKRIGEYEVCDLPKQQKLFVLSLNPEEKMEWRRVIACNRHESPETLIKITTRSGREITATDFHSFVIRKHNKIVSIAGKELKVGDRIPAIRYLPENCASFVNIGGFLPPQMKTIREEGRIRSVRGLTSLPEQMTLDAAFGWFIGAYLSEGHSTGSELCISNINDEFISNVKNFSEGLNLNYKEFLHHRGFAQSRDFKIRSTLFSNFIEAACGTGSGEKKVPDFAYSADERFVASLLKGYFDGDGNISVKRKIIRASSNSKELIDGIALLLTRFGIFAHKTKDKQFGLLIPYKYAPIFLSKIGSDIPEKGKRLKRLAELSKRFWDDYSQDFTDMIGGFDDVLYQVAKKLKYPTRYINNFTKRQKIGRTALHRYIRLFERLAKTKGVDIGGELQILKRMANSDVVWDEIAKIRRIKPSSRYVYDFSVEGLKTFTTFDGIVTHNTMRTYHVAGAAQIEVTLGLPRIVEIFDARRSPKTPTMTVYLKKAYNTKDRAYKIAADIREVKMNDVASSSSIDLVNGQIEVMIDLKEMRGAGLSMSRIESVLKESLKDVDVRSRKGSFVIKPKGDYTIKDIQKLKKKVLDMHLKGLKGVSQAVINQREGDWIITTLGSNFAKVLGVKGVNPARTMTNNIHEVQKVLGVEAARNAIINEAVNTLKDQGLDVDVRHIMLVADVMVADGTIKAIGRYGIAGAKGSVLARANFEETIKHLTKAAVTAESDKLESIVENVMINQVVPAGTGMFDLIFRPPQKK